MSRAEDAGGPADLILHNGRIATLDGQHPSTQAAAVRGGQFVVVGSERDALGLRGDRTQVIDLRGRTAIPGLTDTHMHLIRGGLSYNMELRWDGVPSLADALRMLREQARRTPPPQWVRVVGGWTEFQFAERRMPTLDEIYAAAPDTPVFVLHLYDRALLNRAALRAVGYTRDTPEPPGGTIERDKSESQSGWPNDLRCQGSSRRKNGRASRKAVTLRRATTAIMAKIKRARTAATLPITTHSTALKSPGGGWSLGLTGMISRRFRHWDTEAPCPPGRRGAETGPSRRDGVSREGGSASPDHQAIGEGGDVAVVGAAAAAQHLQAELVL